MSVAIIIITLQLFEFSIMYIPCLSSSSRSLAMERDIMSYIYLSVEEFNCLLWWDSQVKDQGDCGSCWAFSATGALEGQLFKRKELLVALSEQQLMDCSWAYDNYGCDGGKVDRAFDYVRNNGLCSETDYSYFSYVRSLALHVTHPCLATS